MSLRGRIKDKKEAEQGSAGSSESGERPRKLSGITGHPCTWKVLASLFTRSAGICGSDLVLPLFPRNVTQPVVGQECISSYTFSGLGLILLKVSRY